MSATDILTLLRARPFRSFRLCPSDGMRYEVRHPEMVLVALTTAVIGYPLEEQPAAAARYDIVSLRHIVRIDLLDVPEATSTTGQE